MVFSSLKGEKNDLLLLNSVIVIYFANIGILINLLNFYSLSIRLSNLKSI